MELKGATVLLRGVVVLGRVSELGGATVIVRGVRILLHGSA